MDQLLNGMNLNFQVPVGYVLLAISVLWGGYMVIRKTIAIALALVAKVSFGMLCSSILMLAGLTGGGWSVGSLVSGKTEERKAEHVLSNQDIKTLATCSTTNANALEKLLEYTKERDKLLARDRTQYVAAGGVQDKHTEPEYNDYTIPFTTLFGSLGLILCGVVWFIRKM